jgi:hypothetical protein
MAAPHRKKANRPHVCDYHIRCQGLVSADLVVEEGAFIKSVTRTGTGAYLITFQQDPGLFIGWDCALGALVVADLKGYTAVRGVFTAATTTAQATLAFTLFNSSFAAADLLVNQYLDLVVSFSDYGN